MDDARARDSISGRQGSLTPAAALAPARPRRLYYDVYGLIRDILEMSRVHARRVAGKCGRGDGARRAGGEGGEVRDARMGRGNEAGRHTERRVQRPTCRHTRGESESLPLRAVFSPLALHPVPARPPPPPLFVTLVDDTRGSIVRGSINWVSTRLLVPLVSRRYGRSRLVATIGSVRAV